MFFDSRAQTDSMYANILDQSECVRFNLILAAEFPLNALILASEALRISNQNSGLSLFDWSFVSDTGEPVRASNGMWITADCSVAAMPDADVYLLFGGNLPLQTNSRSLLAHLRSASRHGALVGGVDTGAFGIAQAGLAGFTQDDEVVLHWEAVSSFQEEFPELRQADQIYSMQERKVYCAGGVATLDMMLELVARFQDQALANEVAHALVHSRRAPTTPQRNDGLTGANSDSLLMQLVETMERNIESPLTLEELSQEFGMSQRTLARASEREFGMSPMRLYLRVRLRVARNLLFYGEMPVQEIAYASGFLHPAVFSRVFRRHFGSSPSAFRAKFRKQQKLSVRPELRRMITADAQPPLAS